MAVDYVRYELAPLDPVLSTTFLALITTLFAKVKFLGDVSMYPRDDTENILYPAMKTKKKISTDPVFDFIIIGGGTAGCLVANRLSQYQDWKVLLIELGDYPKPATEVPYLYGRLANTTDVWRFYVEKSSNSCLGMTRCKIHRGHSLGGFSSVNNMHYTRGLPSDFDTWDSDNWSSKLVLKASENIENSFGRNSEFEYGRHGDIPLTNSSETDRVRYIRELVEHGYKHFGYQRIPRNTFLGFKRELLTIRFGRRQNSAKTFLSPIKDYRNFSLIKNARVIEILTNDPTDKRATGVEIIDQNGASKTIKAKKDVIVTLGAINTPKLLMLSGIGPRKQLECNNIDLVADLPIGKNLQIHVTVPIYIRLDCCEFREKYYCSNDTIRNAQSMFDYAMYNEGELTTTGLNEFVAYINTKKKNYPLPSIVNYHKFFKVNDTNFAQHVDDMEYLKPIRQSLLDANKNHCILLFLVNLLNPKSVGEVTLNGTNFMQDPVIKTNFYTDEKNLDYDTMLVGVKHVINMIEIEKFVKKGATFVLLDMANCRNFKYCTDHYLRCYIQHMSYPSSDVSSTTPMGKMCDRNKVVTDNLEVKTVRGLRIIDASVMPNIVSGDIEGSVAAIAEMGAEFIKQKWIKDYPPVYKFEEQCEAEEEIEDDDDDYDDA